MIAWAKCDSLSDQRLLIRNETGIRQRPPGAGLFRRGFRRHRPAGELGAETFRVAGTAILKNACAQIQRTGLWEGRQRFDAALGSRKSTSVKTSTAFAALK